MCTLVALFVGLLFVCIGSTKPDNNWAFDTGAFYQTNYTPIDSKEVNGIAIYKQHDKQKIETKEVTFVNEIEYQSGNKIIKIVIPTIILILIIILIIVYLYDRGL
ncbi:hypothetical protein ACOME3_004671 [Neoechinorhynchus agilis]